MTHKGTAWMLLLFTTSCFVASESHSLDANQTLARIKRQRGGCGVTEQRCDSGECVSEDVICDGAEDCKDGSDEGNCATFPCPAYLFKCQYGACINADYVCDGKKHCKDNSDETNAKCGRNKTSTCNRQQFGCDNGQCIDDFDLCDGRADCADASDESVAACGAQRCLNFSFKCAYGACINADLKCNGVNDCVDGSDEKNCPGGRPKPPVVVVITKSPDPPVPVTPPTPPSPQPGGGCLLPTYQANGRWDVFGDNNNLQPGQTVKRGTILQYKCNTGHALNPSNPTALCNDGWSISQPQCLKTCAPIKSSARMTVKCTWNDFAVDCQTPFEGTQAELQCTSLYEERVIVKRPLRFCYDGSWDSALPECVPICGLKSTQAQAQVIGGDDTKRGEYPWMVGIYVDHNKQHVCGGSIITPEITLTAAHCFEHSQDANFYTLAAGKYYRRYDDPRDKDARFSKIKRIIIHDQFRNGENMFAFDIALMVLETPFQPSRYIMPVCIDYDTRFDEAALVGAPGLVTGWGYTTSVDTPSDVLKVLQVNFRSRSTCPLPEDLRKFYELAIDKMCAASSNKGESSCRGDSGGPLIFNQNGRHFVRAIVSLGAKDKTTYGCDSNQVTLFTGVHHHARLIQQYVTQYSNRVATGRNN